APSTMSISGRYILQPEIFNLLETQERGAGGENQLTDAMARLMESQTFTAYEYEGVTHDCGDKIGLLRANVALALKRPDLGDAARAAIKGGCPKPRPGGGRPTYSGSPAPSCRPGDRRCAGRP